MRKKNALLMTLLLCAGTAAAQWMNKPKLAEAPPPPEQVTVIRAGAVIDGRGGEPRRNQAIVIRGNKIVAISALNAPGVPAGQNVKTIDLSRSTVLPGLIDTHTHIFLQGYDPIEGDYDAQLMRQPIAFRSARALVAARRALEQGFTTIRDLETEGAGYGDVGIRMAIDRGYIPGPRMFVVTRAISTTGGYPLHGYAPEVEVPKGVQIADGPDGMRKAAREQMEHGADWIKVYMTHRSWVENGKLVSQPTLTIDEIRAITDEVHTWGRKVACHAYGGVGLHRAIDGGCDSIEHGLDLDEQAIRKMVEKGIWYVPTLSPYYPDVWDKNPPSERDRKRVEVHEPSFKNALRAGMKIAFGTDAGGFKWSEPMAKEFKYMADFGMPAMAIIQSATTRAAEMLGQEGKLGVIAPGAYADIVAVAGDPLKDITELGRISFVMKDGEVFSVGAPAAQ